jgi:hypothetical protein
MEGLGVTRAPHAGRWYAVSRKCFAGVEVPVPLGLSANGENFRAELRANGIRAWIVRLCDLEACLVASDRERSLCEEMLPRLGHGPAGPNGTVFREGVVTPTGLSPVVSCTPTSAKGLRKFHIVWHKCCGIVAL